MIAGEVKELPSLYQLFYYVVPGFNALRVPVRFVVPLVVNAAIVFGVCLDFLLRILMQAVSNREKLMAFIFASLLIMAFAVDRSFTYSDRPVAWTNASIPVAYEVVRANPGSPVLELPMWPPSRDTFKYFYYQMQDWNPRLGGISSFFPRSFYELSDQTNNCPDQECLESVAGSEAEVLIVHLESLDLKERSLWKDVDLEEHGFSLQKQSDLNTLAWLRHHLST